MNALAWVVSFMMIFYLAENVELKPAFARAPTDKMALLMPLQISNLSTAEKAMNSSLTRLNPTCSREEPFTVKMFRFVEEQTGTADANVGGATHEKAPESTRTIS